MNGLAGDVADFGSKGLRYVSDGYEDVSDKISLATTFLAADVYAVSQSEGSWEKYGNQLKFSATAIMENYNELKKQKEEQEKEAIALNNMKSALSDLNTQLSFQKDLVKVLSSEWSDYAGARGEIEATTEREILLKNDEIRKKKIEILEIEKQLQSIGAVTATSPQEFEMLSAKRQALRDELDMKRQSYDQDMQKLQTTQELLTLQDQGNQIQRDLRANELVADQDAEAIKRKLTLESTEQQKAKYTEIGKQLAANTAEIKENTTKAIKDSLDVALKEHKKELEGYKAKWVEIKTLIESIKIPAASAGGGGGGGSSGGSKKDFLMRPGQEAVNFSPDDTIIGVKRPQDLSGGGKGITVNIANVYGTDPTQIAQALQSELNRLLTT